jgi:hypothetical protein
MKLFKKKFKNLGKLEYTSRGFEFIEFLDLYEYPCSLQQSSLCHVLNDKPGSTAIWLGVLENRMHLDKTLVKALIKNLKHWINIGSFK